MKPFIIGVGTLILSIFVSLTVSDVKTYQRYNFELKYACEELSATGSLYNDNEEYSNGRKIFNQTEAEKAIREQLKSMLTTDDFLKPLHNSYWTENIELHTYYIDDSNTTFPYLFVDPLTGYTVTFTMPAVAVTINAGNGRFTFPWLFDTGQAIRSASHEWKEY